MPTFTDGKGGSRFHMNPQMGKHLAGKSESEPDKSETEHDNGDSDLVLSKHGDGTYHTARSNGEDRTEHPSLAHATSHMAHHMEPEHKHVHVHSHDGVHETHKMDEAGAHEEHDHQNIDELTRDLSQFFNEEKQEGSEGGHSYSSEPSHEGNSPVAHLMS